jgi:hypothetical protein
VHKDSQDARQKALRMGANLLQYAFTAPWSGALNHFFSS